MGPSDHPAAPPGRAAWTGFPRRRRRARATAPAAALARLIALAACAAAFAHARPASAGDSDSLQVVRAMLHDGRYADADAAAERLLDRERTTASPDSVRIAEILDARVEAMWRGGKAADPRARALGYEALGIKERRRGPGDLSVATTLMHLSIVLRRSGDFDAAGGCLERALAIRERSLGPDHPDVATALNGLGNLLRERGRYAAADSAYRRALAIRERALGAAAPEVAQTLDNLAASLQAEGDAAGSRPLLERALAIQRKALGEDHLDVALTLENLGNACAALGDRAAARGSYERCLAIRERRLGPEHPDVATAADNLGLLLLSDDRFDDARALLERARAIRETSLGPEHASVAASLDHVAGLLTETGDYAGARPLFERALAIRERALGADHPLVAETLNNLGRLLGALGEFPEARRDLERALAIDRARGQHAHAAANLSNLALIRRAEGDAGEALALMRRALAERAIDAPADSAPPPMLADLGLLLRDAGRVEEADSLLRVALDRAERAFGRDDPRTATFVDVLAACDGARGRWRDAAARYARAIGIWERALGPGHREVLYAMHQLAQARLAAGDSAGALSAALEAVRRSDLQLRRAFDALPERQALHLALGVTSGYDVVMALAARGLPPGARRDALDALIRTRALVLDGMVARRAALAEATDSLSRALYERYRRAGERSAALSVGGAGSASLEEARAALDAAERALAERCAPVRSRTRRDSLGLASVEAALPPRTALVSFARYAGPRDRRGTARATAAPSGSSSEYLAFVLRSGSPVPDVVPLGPADVVDGLVMRWQREAARGPALHAARRALAAYRAAGARLRQAAWDPIAARLADVERVLVVPDGALNLVTLAALPVGSDRYLLQDGPRIHYLSAERDVVAPEPAHAGGAGGLLVVGDPDFDGVPDSPVAVADGAAPEPPAGAERGVAIDCPDFAGVRFPRLPASRREADDVVALWDEARSHSRAAARAGERAGAGDAIERAGAGDAVGRAGAGDAAAGAGAGDAIELTGAQADEAAFKRLAPGRAVLHLATHGFCLGASCEGVAGVSRGIGGLVSGGFATAAVQSPSGATSDGAPAAGRGIELAGLALAGANRRATALPGHEDGVLTAEEVGAIDLSGVGWAVLSACDTGLGDVVSGEGVLGLRRAFRVAGARTLVMSLWDVDDEATRQWMHALYAARFVRGLATDEAVRAAGLEVLERRAAHGQSTHPFFWGAFVAAGDWN